MVSNVCIDGETYVLPIQSFVGAHWNKVYTHVFTVLYRDE